MSGLGSGRAAAPPAGALAAMLASASSLFVGFTVLRSAVAGFALYYLVCCVGIPLFDFLFLRRAAGRDIPALVGLGTMRRSHLLLGLGAGGAMVAIMLAALAILRGPVFGDGTIMAALARWGVDRDRLPAVFAVMLAFNGAVEEFFWRGYLHGSLSAMADRRLAGALPTLFFGCQHVFVVSAIVRDPAVVALFIAGITGAGAAWAFMRERSRSLLPCVVSHMMVTAGYMGAFYLMSAPA